jgi:fructosamine-3-kinase
LEEVGLSVELLEFFDGYHRTVPKALEMEERLNLFQLRVALFNVGNFLEKLLPSEMTFARFHHIARVDSAGL